MKRTRWWLALLPLLAACGGGHKIVGGTVIRHDYSPERDETVWIQNCVSYGKYGCQAWVPVPIEEHHNQKFTLLIEEPTGHRGHVTVDEQSWHAIHNGDHWTAS